MRLAAGLRDFEQPALFRHCDRHLGRCAVIIIMAASGQRALQPRPERADRRAEEWRGYMLQATFLAEGTPKPSPGPRLGERFYRSARALCPCNPTKGASPLEPFLAGILRARRGRSALQIPDQKVPPWNPLHGDCPPETPARHLWPRFTLLPKNAAAKSIPACGPAERSCPNFTLKHSFAIGVTEMASASRTR